MRVATSEPNGYDERTLSLTFQTRLIRTKTTCKKSYAILTARLQELER